MPALERFLLVSLIIASQDAVSVLAQERSAWFGRASLGPVIQDRQGNQQLRQTGLVLDARVGRRISSSVAAVVSLSHTSITRKVDEAVTLPGTFLRGIPCPDADPLPCGPDPFIGPVKAVIAGAGIEASAGSGRARVSVSLAPGLYWLYERAPESDGTFGGIGVGAGGAVRLMDPVWVVLDLRYHQLFSSGPTPRWLVPVSLGVQVR